MLWLVKQSTLTWLLLTFMFQGMLLQLASCSSVVTRSHQLIWSHQVTLAPAEFLFLEKFAILSVR